VESVRLDGDDHAWWVQEEVKEVWRPRANQPPAEEPQRDILADHFGADWRTSFGFTPKDDQQTDGGSESRAEEQDPYEVLDIEPTATWDEIVAAHRHQARVNHPDLLFGQSDAEKAESEERIRIINAAYKELRVRRGM
jgi:DnaJ-domain-containing protein 1